MTRLHMQRGQFRLADTLDSTGKRGFVANPRRRRACQIPDIHIRTYLPRRVLQTRIQGLHAVGAVAAPTAVWATVAVMASAAREPNRRLRD